MDKALILARTALFQNLSDKALAAIAEITRSAECEKKQVFFYEGERGSALYVLITGSVQLYKSSSDGRRIVIKVVKPGEMFAEVVLFEQDRYPVSAVALKKSLVFKIPAADFLSLIHNENFLKDFLGALMGKLRYLTSQIQYLSSHDCEDRLFLFLYEQHGPSEEIYPSLTKKDYARAIGTTPETFSRLLLRLKKQGLLRWERKRITIPAGVWKEKMSLR